MKVGDVIEGKYELRSLLGEGGMGSVFEARHTRIGRKMALKTLNPKLTANKEMVERFLREAQAAAAIGSEYIIDITDAGETSEGMPFLVMEYLEGQDLSQIIRAQAPLAPVQAAYLMNQVCLGVGAAHARGIVHRDLKPGNIYVTRRTDGSPWVKVLDFGIAKFRAALVEEVPELTSSGAVMGTPFYMAPEQAQGAKNIDHRVDIYSAGVIFFELLSGVRPYEGSNYNELIVRVATKEPKSLLSLRPGLDEAVERVVRRAMERDLGGRYQTMAEFGEGLEPFLGQHNTPVISLDVSSTLNGTQRTELPKTTVQPLGFPPTRPLPPTISGVDTPIPATSGRKTSRLWLLVGAVVGGIAVASGLILFLTRSTTRDEEPGAISAPLMVSEPAPSKLPAATSPGAGLQKAQTDTATKVEGSSGPEKSSSLGPEPPRRPARLAPEDRGFVDEGRRKGMEWGNRCFVHIGDKRYDAARAACYKGLENAHEPFILGALYYNLGRVEENEGRLEEARWYYQRSLQVRPGNPSVTKRLELITTQ